MEVHRVLNKMKRANNICLNTVFCTYCHQYMHTYQDCLHRKTDISKREYRIKQSNIPEKYWKSEDPLKYFLMNNTVRGYSNRVYWENKNGNKIEKPFM